MQKRLLFKIDYVCKIPPSAELGHFYLTIYIVLENSIKIAMSLYQTVQPEKNELKYLIQTIDHEIGVFTCNSIYARLVMS